MRKIRVMNTQFSISTLHKLDYRYIFNLHFRYVLDAIAGIKAEPENIDEYKKNLADQIYNNTKSVFFPAS